MTRKCIKRFYFQYQTEAMPKGISIEQFCSRNKVPYNINKGMAADEQKRYINYLADRVNADDLEKRAMKLVLQDFLDKQKEYDVRLSKLDAVLSDVEDLLTSSLIKCILCVTKSGNMSFLSNDVMRD